MPSDLSCCDQCCDECRLQRTRRPTGKPKCNKCYTTKDLEYKEDPYLSDIEDKHVSDWWCTKFYIARRCER